MIRLLKSLYLTNRLFTISGLIAFLFILSFLFPPILTLSKVFLYVFVAFILTDVVLMYRVKKGLYGQRFTPDRLSNGDENEIRLYFENLYLLKINLRIFDEIPHQFQRRDIEFNLDLRPGETKTLSYYLRPVKRGEYSFGAVNAFASSPLSLISRRFRFSQDKMVPVYPSYIQMRQYELLAISQHLLNSGIKKIRKIGNNQEFELIKEYVMGDDFRTVNWNATARRGKLMTNHYQDEKSQQVISLIDKGRVMQMPFNGLSLLDYAINASLVISNIAIKKDDKAGLITFQDRISSALLPSRSNKQLSNILETLYNQKTAYLETDFSALHHLVKRKVSQRSLLLLFTNFESLFALERQLPYLLSLARQHLLVVIFFENTELTSLLESSAPTLKDIYFKGIAERLYFEKKLIVKELVRHGIQALLTPPDRLTVNTINKYLELKARSLI